MGAFVLAAANIDKHSVEGHASLPQFRKASLGMIYTHAAVTKLFGAVPDAVTHVGADQCALLVGTSQGELGATKEFFVSLALKGMARPIIFQNSLHNATQGFLSLSFGLSGQTLTVSHGYVSGEDALSTALLMLDQGLCRLAVVVAYDLLVDGLEEVRDLFYPYNLKRSNGAAALLLANEQGLRHLGHAVPQAFIQDVKVSYQTRALTPSEVAAHFDDEHYEADGLAKFVRCLQTPGVRSPLRQLKPDGMETHITFDRL